MAGFVISTPPSILHPAPSTEAKWMSDGAVYLDSVNQQALGMQDLITAITNAMKALPTGGLFGPEVLTAKLQDIYNTIYGNPADTNKLQNLIEQMRITSSSLASTTVSAPAPVDGGGQPPLINPPTTVTTTPPRMTTATFVFGILAVAALGAGAIYLNKQGRRSNPLLLAAAEGGAKTKKRRVKRRRRVTVKRR